MLAHGLFACVYLQYHKEGPEAFEREAKARLKADADGWVENVDPKKVWMKC